MQSSQWRRTPLSPLLVCFCGVASAVSGSKARPIPWWEWCLNCNKRNLLMRKINSAKNSTITKNCCVICIKVIPPLHESRKRQTRNGSGSDNDNGLTTGWTYWGIIMKGSPPGPSLQRTGLLFPFACRKADVTSPNDPSHCALPVVRNRVISDSELILRALLNRRCLISSSYFSGDNSWISCSTVSIFVLM